LEQKKEDLELNEKNMMEEMKKQQKNIDLRAIDEGGFENSTEGKPDRMLLNGFTHANIKLHFLAEKDMHTLAQKQRFHRLFDVGVLSVASDAAVDKGMYSDLFKDKAIVHAETGDFLVNLKGENKVKFREMLVGKAKTAGWKNIEDAPFNHHMLFEVNNPIREEELEKKEEVDDFLDLNF